MASFFKQKEGEQPVDYAVRIFERLYSFDINKVLTMEVSCCIGLVFICTL